MPQTDTTAPAPAYSNQSPEEPRTGEELAEIRHQQAVEDHEVAQDALSANKDVNYGVEPRSLESNPPLDPVKDVLTDYWERTEEAKNDNDGVSGNQDEPAYQPETQILQDPPEAPEDDDDKSAESATTQPQAKPAAAESQQQSTAQSQPKPSTQTSTAKPSTST